MTPLRTARTSIPRLAILLLGVGAAACDGSSPGGVDSETHDAVVKKAQEALKPLKKNLMGALKSAIEKGGPVEALDVCRIKAPAIAREASSPEIQVGRTSHKVRNPNNAPDDWMKPYLQKYQATGGGAEEKTPPFEVVPLESGRFGYLEPIYVKPLCLTCHGENIPEPVSEKLAETYTKDQATGFEVNDFRGLFWAKVTP